MRFGLLFCVGVLVFAPISPLDGDGEAEAQRRSKRKKVKRSPKRPVIKLQETPATEPASAPQTTVPQRGPTRLDFDDRLVQGQTNRAGSVYLYDRKELKTEPMVKKRESFRDAIIESVYDPEPQDRGTK